LVFNLVDHVTNSSGSFIFNTNVALDNDGAFLGKYHKLNLWGEPNMDVPSDCPAMSFKSTSLGGVEFGIVTCADLIYELPVATLLGRNVLDFLVPVAWDYSMAQMQVMGWAQGFSATYGVNLVVSNHRTADESGSGIWANGLPLATQFDPSKQGSSSVVVADVPHAEGRSHRYDPNVTDQQRHVVRVTNGWNITALHAGASVCSGSVCCAATDIFGSDGSGYVLASLDGYDYSLGLEWGAKLCAILPCEEISESRSLPSIVPGVLQNDSDVCLYYEERPATGVISGSLNMQRSNNSEQTRVLLFPEVLGAPRADLGSQVALDPTFAAFSSGKGFIFNDDEEADGSGGSIISFNSSHGLLSAVIYGRVFADDSLPYSC